MTESLTVDGVMAALRNCYDPEIPVNIVDLGLIYNIAIDQDAVRVRMTLTTMGCPAHAYLMHQVQTEVEKIPGVKKAEVEIVWDPPWTPDKMNPEARKRLEAGREEATIEFNPATFKPKNKGHIAKNPDGKVVLINESNARYLGSEDIANLWERSNGEKTLDEIIIDIANEKKLASAEVRMQILESVTQLITIGLLRPEEAIMLPLHK
ncbi:MAG TPA: metal-sulfur cluster assembly factor [Candidatus Dormibacteraeota bacterium]|nr:metal-sulfur cluster assembly factor [Candidatus Dormibacteraeota bacterium]